jgi:membrane protease subunit HflC
MKTVFIFLFLLTGYTLIQSGVFIVKEGSQVVLTQFGKIIGKPYVKAGLYFKIPYVWKAHYFDKRIYIDSDYQVNVATKDQYFISVDTVVNWRIKEADTFFVMLDGTDDETRIILRNIVSGSVREVVSNYDLVETVRSKNLSKDGLSLVYYKKGDMKQEGGIHDEVHYGRKDLADEMKQRIVDYTKLFGIEIVKVLITDVRYTSKVENRVYERMVQERFRAATKLRSTGMKHYQMIMGELDMKYQSIIAPAERKALIIKGQAEGKAIDIYARSFGQNRQFYTYWRMLKAYDVAIPAMSQGAFFSTDSAFLKLLNGRGMLQSLKK